MPKVTVKAIFAPGNYALKPRRLSKCWAVLEIVGSASEMNLKHHEG